MAGTTRNTTLDIERDLVNQGNSFSFFQAIRLIGQLHSAEGVRHRSGCLPNGLQIRPNLSLAFPRSDVESVQVSTDGNVTLTTNMLGLYGTCSPLPAFYTEELMDDVDQGVTATKDFIDALNHRIYALLFEGWNKYRFMNRTTEQNSRDCWEMLFSLCGFNEQLLASEYTHPRELLRYTGLFVMKSRPASGLESLIRDMLEGVGVTVHQGVERSGKIPEEQQCRLGMGLQLGNNSYMGGEYKDRSGSFRIEIGPLTRDTYKRLAPGTDDYRKLIAVTRLYVNSPIEFDIELVMDPAEKPETVVLGGADWSRLGLDTWVFSDDGPDEFRSRLCPCREKKAA